MWWIYALLSAFFAALTAILAKVGIRNVNADLATGIRTIVILLVTWTIVFMRGATSSFHTLTKNNLLFICLSGIATGLSWVFYFKALQLGQVSKVASVDKLSVALAIVLAVVFLGEVLTWKTAIGALLIVAGTIVLII